jgi:rubrerythrin
MINFWEWVQSRQDVRQWSEDERACAEIAWKDAIKLMEREYEARLDKLNSPYRCAKCGDISSDNAGGYSAGGTA